MRAHAYTRTDAHAHIDCLISRNQNSSILVNLFHAESYAPPRMIHSIFTHAITGLIETQPHATTIYVRLTFKVRKSIDGSERFCFAQGRYVRQIFRSQRFSYKCILFEIDVFHFFYIEKFLTTFPKIPKCFLRKKIFFFFFCLNDSRHLFKSLEFSWSCKKFYVFTLR